MKKMISVASGFQYSVNIAYDLNNNQKLKNFIPTRASLDLLEEILLSTQSISTERSRILIGAYGKGKSHIVLTILAMLMKKDRGLFENLNLKIDENPQLSQLVKNYYESNEKILPVIISGSNTSLTQAFLLGLQRTLDANGLLDIMPETNYQAAINVIDRWANEFPQTFEAFKDLINVPVSEFKDSLLDFDIETYERFEQIYPKLTAGSTFNPFLGFDVVELYESVLKELKKRGYTGLYVVYDEFSKYLEANILEASVSDTKMLQDFAEKCNRSGSDQLHIMLISHKEIANYIDKLPKQKTDGWRGVSERFKHIHLNNNFSQTYEIIASVILKDENLWRHFRDRNKEKFENLISRYVGHPIFDNLDKDSVKQVIDGCYPLHPISTFILPRLSERVAQNERTLFTFLSADGVSTLLSYLKRIDENDFCLLTPDLIYDYFAPLFEKEVYAGSLHEIYVLTKSILVKLDEDSLESKIVKTLSLTYILEQFEMLAPTKDEIFDVFSNQYEISLIEEALDNLIRKEYVVYLKRSNGFLRLKETSGVDVQQMISDTVEKQKRLQIKEALNQLNYDKYLYPSRYNDDKEMTRYFAFEFINADEIESGINWDIKSETIKADGVVYGVLINEETNISELSELLLNHCQEFSRYVFVLPKSYEHIESVVRELNAVTTLRENATGDKVLFDEYDVIYDDLREMVSDFISSYTHPEKRKSLYIFNGKKFTINRKAVLSELLSSICDDVYNMTPIIVNEAINKDEITTIAKKSRDKIIASLLRNDLDYNLGFTGYGQEVSMMRSTLIRTNVLVQDNHVVEINLTPENEQIAHMMKAILNFLQDARLHKNVNFKQLYDVLTLPEYHIGMRKGIIPIYMAAVFHKFKKEIFLYDNIGEMPLTVDALLQIEANPENYYLSYADWNDTKENYVQRLEELFSEYVIPAEKSLDVYGYVANAMRRWYMSLPKYSKERRKTANGEKINRKYSRFINLLKQNVGSYELVFEKIPQVLGYKDTYSDELMSETKMVKRFFDNALNDLKKNLEDEMKRIFASSETTQSLTSVISGWCSKLDKTVFEQLFTDGTDRCLKLFLEAGNNDDAFVVRVSKFTTDLRLEDWNDSTKDLMMSNLKKYKETAENFQSEIAVEDVSGTQTYQLTYIDESGKPVTKRFEKVNESRRGKLLYNRIVSAIDAMGFAVSDQEKRQILMEVLKKLC